MRAILAAPLFYGWRRHALAVFSSDMELSISLSDIIGYVGDKKGVSGKEKPWSMHSICWPVG